MKTVEDLQNMETAPDETGGEHEELSAKRSCGDMHEFLPLSVLTLIYLSIFLCNKTTMGRLDINI
jgi:hypothetical protein